MSRSCRHILFLACALFVLLGTGVDRAMGQTPTYEWINPAGGSWNDPSNWSEGVVPGPGDDVEFLLAGPLQVVTTGATAFDLLVRGSSTEIIAPGCDLPGIPGLSILGTLSIDANGSGVPGRFRLTDADCLVSRIERIDVAGAVAGATGLGSFELAGATELANGQMTLDRLACMRILLGDDREFSKPFLRTDGTTEMGGGLRLSPHQGTFPEIGTVVELMDTSPGSVVFMPAFGLIEAPVSVDVDLEIQKDPASGFDLRAYATIDAAALLLEATVVQESDAYSARVVEIDVSDFDSSGGGSDFVIFRSDGVIEVLLRVPAGEFQSGATLFTAPDLIDGAAGDFNDDGTSDLAVITSNGDDTGTLRLFFNAGGGEDSDWSTGPTRLISGEPVSISPIGIPNGFLAAKLGVAVSSKEGGSRGVTRAIETGDSGTTETGEVEVGDEPGPSDPIDDENKKDPEGPIGVGGTSDGLVGGPAFYVLESTGGTIDSLVVVRTFDLPGRAVDFASRDLDWDGMAETLVVTENDSLVLLQPSEFTGRSSSAVSLPEGALSIDIGEFSSAQQVPYVTIGFEDGSIRIYRFELAETFGFRIFLEQELRYDFESGAIRHVVVTDAFEPRLVGGFQTRSSSQVKNIRIDLASVPGCTQADLDGDGRVGAGDMGLLFGAWGRCRDCAADLNGDGVVDGEDLALIFSLWGPC